MKSFGQVGVLDLRCMSVCHPLTAAVGNARLLKRTMMQI